MHEDSSAGLVIRTLGHGTLDVPDFVDLVRFARIDTIVDVRRHPGSRRFPHFGQQELAGWLPEHGVGYRWVEELGGRRRGVEGSPNTSLRNAQLRAYADHMATESFRAAVRDLLALAVDRSIAVMCSESVWWRCHRRLLADHLVLVEEVRVEHLFHDGRLDPHDPLAAARVTPVGLVYAGPDGRQQQLTL